MHQKDLLFQIIGLLRRPVTIFWAAAQPRMESYRLDFT